MKYRTKIKLKQKYLLTKLVRHVHTMLVVKLVFFLFSEGAFLKTPETSNGQQDCVHTIVDYVHEDAEPHRAIICRPCSGKEKFV